MIVIGLTGSIGMGKSTVASQFAEFGASVCNADSIVHGLLAEGGEAVAAIAEHFPSAVTKGAVDRKALGAIVFSDKLKLKTLEQILHPLVVAKENAFVRQERLKQVPVVVLDIPLLFETGGEKRCDITVVASAPLVIQRQRVMERPGMTEEKFAAILSTQMPDAEKCRRADYVVQTGLGLAHSKEQVAKIMGAMHAA